MVPVFRLRKRVGDVNPDVSSVEGKPANRLLLAVKHGKALLPIVNRQMHIRNKQGHYSAQMIDFCRDFYLKL